MLENRDNQTFGTCDYPILGSRDYPILGNRDDLVLGNCDYPILGIRGYTILECGQSQGQLPLGIYGGSRGQRRLVCSKIVISWAAIGFPK